MKDPKEERRLRVEQLLASWAIEGFVPDQTYLDLLEAYIQGRMTMAEVDHRVDLAFGVKGYQEKE
ncbi:antitoxin VbhA family protein [Herbaspirillum seropedicae]|uniref:antitoxin VbhA family protein n=1 Tax=Herbaspirillum seropedicae TaxID=964 RepID=UPI003F8D3190